jgi:hypothetical protein
MTEILPLPWILAVAAAVNRPPFGRIKNISPNGGVVLLLPQLLNTVVRQPGQ